MHILGFILKIYVSKLNFHVAIWSKKNSFLWWSGRNERREGGQCLQSSSICAPLLSWGSLPAGARSPLPHPPAPPCFCAPSSLCVPPAADTEGSLYPSGNSFGDNRRGTLKGGGGGKKERLSFMIKVFTPQRACRGNTLAANRFNQFVNYSVCCISRGANQKESWERARV